MDTFHNVVRMTQNSVSGVRIDGVRRDVGSSAKLWEIDLMALLPQALIAHSTMSNIEFIIEFMAGIIYCKIQCLLIYEE